MTDKELKKILKSMSLREKAAQLLQLPGALYKEGSDVQTGPLAELGLTPEDLAMAGSVLGVGSPRDIRAIQKAYLEKNPHKIPLLFMLDVINGCDTVYPIPLAQGATFDAALVKSLAKMAARETALNGVHVTFSPMVDTVRDARWGRCMESTGEDPYLNAVMAKAAVRGYQGRGYRLTGEFEDDRVAACVKHFAAYGAPTAGRDYNNVELSERTLRDDYLPAYRAAVDAGVAMVMTSFNTLNRVPSTANRWLMHDVLRREWGFDGVVITDYAAIAELLAHGVAEDARAAARLAMEADVDIDMCTASYAKELPKLVKERAVSARSLDEAVMRVLRLKNALGLFENPYRGLDEEALAREALSEKNRKRARKAAEESFVLLENDGMLPLEMKKRPASAAAAAEPCADTGTTDAAEQCPDSAAAAAEQCMDTGTTDAAKQHSDSAAAAAEQRTDSAAADAAPQAVKQALKRRVAFVGPYAVSRELFGAWSFIDPAGVVTIREAAEKKMAGKFDLVFAKGCEAVDCGRRVAGVGGRAESSLTPQELAAAMDEAVAAAGEADDVIVCIGEHRAQSGEAASRANITVPDDQMELLRRVQAVNPNVAVVLFAGRPLDLREVKSLARAVLLVWFPGVEGGSAIVNTLIGKSNPSGKLPVSLPYCVGQAPVHYAQLSTGRPLPSEAAENVFFSRYTDIPNEPLYAFGYGRSYTRFAISPVTLDGALLCKMGKKGRDKKAAASLRAEQGAALHGKWAAGGKALVGKETRGKTAYQEAHGKASADAQKQEAQELLLASVTVTNVGEREGTEVVQLYIRDLVGSVARPVRELKGFQRVRLQPGESAQVTFEITERMLRFTTLSGRFESEPGRFEVFIGDSSQTQNGAAFCLQ